MRDTRTAFVLISHDRAFLRALSKATLWIDRGAGAPPRSRVRRVRGLARNRLGRGRRGPPQAGPQDQGRGEMGRRRASAPGASATRAGSARLPALRAERSRADPPAGHGGDGTRQPGRQSGKRVIEAKGLTKRFGDKTIVQDFDLRVLRGDRVAFVGPNGVGKTTLLKMLTGETRAGCGHRHAGHQPGDRGLRPDPRAARSRMPACGTT